MRPLKILIVCNHASRRFGGEAMLPYKYFQYLKKLGYEVYLLTHERTRPDFEGVENVKFVPDTKMHKLMHKLGTYLPSRIDIVTTNLLSHQVSQIYQWVYARRIIKAKGIDIVHEVAPVSPKQPSFMVALGVPVIIGPMNGGMNFPKPFKAMGGKFEGSVQHFARFTSHIFNLLLPGKLFANRLLVANPRTKAALPCFRLGKVEQVVENAADQISDNKRELPKPNDSNETRVLFVGRLVDWKTLDIIIDALSQINSTKVYFDIVGDGPDRAKLEMQASNLRNVTFHGWVDHVSVNQFYDQADIFVLPSVRECGGAVVLEAMARGVPTIATAWGGPVDYIAEGTGLLVEPTSRAYMVETFKKHIEDLANNPEKRIEMGNKAREHIKQHFLWEPKVKQMVKLYETVIEESA